jgi:hypothetical protein
MYHRCSSRVQVVEPTRGTRMPRRSCRGGKINGWPIPTPFHFLISKNLSWTGVIYVVFLRINFAQFREDFHLAIHRRKRREEFEQKPSVNCLNRVLQGPERGRAERWLTTRLACPRKPTPHPLWLRLRRPVGFAADNRSKPGSHSRADQCNCDLSCLKRPLLTSTDRRWSAFVYGTKVQ